MVMPSEYYGVGRSQRKVLISRWGERSCLGFLIGLSAKTDGSDRMPSFL